MNTVELQRRGMELLIRSVDERPNPFPPVAIAEEPRWKELAIASDRQKNGGPPLNPPDVFELADLNDRARMSGTERNPK